MKQGSEMIKQDIKHKENYEKIYLLEWKEPGENTVLVPREIPEEKQLNGEGQGMQEALWERGLALLDAERLRRAQSLRNPAKRMEALGAGLLLQKAVRDWQAGQKDGAPVTAELSFSRLVRELEAYGAPLPLKYRYGEGGKPYFQELSLFFSLSHSGRYVLCAVSGQEVGADIQEKRLPVKQALVNRYFADRERDSFRILCRKCGPGEEAAASQEGADWFYRMWCRKEAWGKLTGQGVAAVLGQDCETQREVGWQESETADGRCRIAICRYRDCQEKREDGMQHLEGSGECLALQGNPEVEGKG